MVHSLVAGLCSYQLRGEPLQAVTSKATKRSTCQAVLPLQLRFAPCHTQDAHDTLSPDIRRSLTRVSTVGLPARANVILPCSGLTQNQAGKPRVQKFYTPYPTHKRLGVIQRIFELVRERPDTLCNFIEIPSDEFEDDQVIQARRQRQLQLQQSRTGGGDYAMSTAAKEEEEPEEQVLRVIYRHYATLYFVFCVDEAESELGILDLIQVSPLKSPSYPFFPHSQADMQTIFTLSFTQVFVESLDRCFENVCELDLIFNFDQIHSLLSCMIVGGYVQDTSVDSIAALFTSLQKSRKASQQAGTIQLPELSLGSGSAGMASVASWSERLTRNLGRGRLGR